METPDKRQELQKMMMEGETYRKQLDSLRNEARMLEATMEEVRASIAAFDLLKQSKAGANILMPIGSGCFIKAKLAETENVIVGVGAGISVEKTVDEAKKFLEERAETVGRSMDKMQKMAYELNERILTIEELSKDLVGEMQAAQKQKK